MASAILAEGRVLSASGSDAGFPVLAVGMGVEIMIAAGNEVQIACGGCED